MASPRRCASARVEPLCHSDHGPSCSGCSWADEVKFLELGDRSVTLRLNRDLSREDTSGLRERRVVEESRDRSPQLGDTRRRLGTQAAADVRRHWLRMPAAESRRSKPTARRLVDATQQSIQAPVRKQSSSSGLVRRSASARCSLRHSTPSRNSRQVRGSWKIRASTWTPRSVRATGSERARAICPLNFACGTCTAHRCTNRRQRRLDAVTFARR
jgi:hypothetical protein